MLGCLDILQNVWAARKKLDGRCDYRKSWEILSKRSFSQYQCRQEYWVTSGTSSALAVRLWVAGKQKLSVVGYGLSRILLKTQGAWS